MSLILAGSISLDSAFKQTQIYRIHEECSSLSFALTITLYKSNGANAFCFLSSSSPISTSTTAVFWSYRGPTCHLSILILHCFAGAGLPTGLLNHMKGEVLSPFVGPKKKTIVGLLVLNQGVTKRCRLSSLTNSALVYEPKSGGRGRVAGSQPMSTAVHRRPNKLWR